jgi:pentatricopeptide repeat protein
MLSSSRALCRGYQKPEILGGNPNRYNVRRIGAVPRVRNIYKSLSRHQPQKLLRAVVAKPRSKMPVLWQRADMLIEMHNALIVKRHEQQVEHTSKQLSVTLRNADDFIQKHLIDNQHRPSLHTLWFHDRGLQRQQHVIALMPSHSMIPFISLLAEDLEEGKVTIDQVEEVYHALSESTVAHADIVKRELNNTMLRCYVLSGNLDKALTVVHDMKANDVRRNFITYAPLFRHARNNMDVELDDEIRDMIREVEGGAIAKAVYIDTPRVLSLGWVFIRYNWAFIWSCILVVSGFITGIVLLALGLA